MLIAPLAKAVNLTQGMDKLHLEIIVDHYRLPMYALPRCSVPGRQ